MNFYENEFGLFPNQTLMFCMNQSDTVNNFWNISTFNFYSDLFISCKAWMNVYLYNETNSPRDYLDMLLTTNIDSDSLNALVHGKTS
jgi:hypothetical protein